VKNRIMTGEERCILGESHVDRARESRFMDLPGFAILTQSRLRSLVELGAVSFTFI